MEQKLQLRVQLIVLFDYSDSILEHFSVKVWILVDLILLKQIEAEWVYELQELYFVWNVVDILQ